jgi:hypothetical protein
MATVTTSLLRFLSFDLAPAQLCLMRVLDSNTRYIFRVRYGDVHLDYPVELDMIGSDPRYSDWDDVHRLLVAASRMVVPPGLDPMGERLNPYPVILPSERWPYVR